MAGRDTLAPTENPELAAPAAPQQRADVGAEQGASAPSEAADVRARSDPDERSQPAADARAQADLEEPSGPGAEERVVDLRLELLPSEPAPGDSFSLRVDARPPDDRRVGSYRLTLSFHPHRLRFLGVDSLSPMLVVNAQAAEAGVLRVAAAAPGGLGTTLFSGSFRKLAPGPVDVSLDAQEVVDVDFQPLRVRTPRPGALRVRTPRVRAQRERPRRDRLERRQERERRRGQRLQRPSP